jgi:hypothetical protein
VSQLLGQLTNGYRLIFVRLFQALYKREALTYDEEAATLRVKIRQFKDKIQRIGS